MIKRNPLLYIALKDLKDNRRERASLVVSETLLIALFAAGVLGYQLFSNEESDDYFMREDGLSRLFVSAGSIMLLCGLVLLIATIIPYLGKRVPKYTLFKRMGMSARDYRRMIVVEAGITYLFSIAAGMLLGLTFTSVLKRIMVPYIGIDFNLGTVSPLTYPIICAVTLGVYALSFLLTRELEADFRVITSTQETARIERMQGRVPVKKIIAGCILCVLTSVVFRRIEYHEAMYLTTVFFYGLYLAVKNASSILMMHIRKNRPERYYRNLLSNNQLYNRFQTTTRYMLAFSLISFLACFNSGFQIIGIANAEPPEDLFPYDIMCLADENDTAYFDSLRENSAIEMHEYPMVRVANLDKTEHFERIHETTIQGQQIGISESTYHELKKAVDPSYVPQPLGLDDEGNSIYIVHQQDSSVKAQPLDWHYDKSRPDVHVGVTCISVFDPFHSTYVEKSVAGEEIGCLTGCYSTPKCENLVVFSDNYFKEAQNEWRNVDVMTGQTVDDFKEWLGDDAEPLLIQGPTTLMLINTDEATARKLDNEMNTMEEEHKYIGNYDPSVHFHYSSYREIQQVMMERAARISINICLMVILLIMCSLLLYSKCQMELKEKKGREKLLKSLGMAYRERKRVISREINMFFIVPVVALIIASSIFLPETYAARMYDAGLAADCTRMYLILIAAWIAINAVFTWLIGILMRKEILTDE